MFRDLAAVASGDRQLEEFAQPVVMTLDATKRLALPD
jgi:hypothetical protein